MEITSDELRKALDLILKHLEENNNRTFNIDEDYYWDIDENQLYNPQEKPVEIDLGQLSFDLDEIKDLVKGNDIKQSIGWHLIPLAAILRYLGTKNID